MPTLVQRPPTGTTTASLKKRRVTPWWQILAAALAALFLLLATIVLLAWALPHWPRPPLRRGSIAPISLTLQPAEPTPTPGLHPTETVPQQPEYIRTPDNRASDTPPPDPKFISHQDTQAASEKPPEDPTKPLPSQDGKEISSFDFDSNPYIPGKEAHDNLLAGETAQAAAAPAPTPPPANTPQPSPTPEPTATPEPGDFLTLRSELSPANTPPPPEPRTTPPPPTPPIKDLLEAQRQRVARENPSISSAGVRQPPGYQPQTIQTKMSGSVDSRTGKASVAALGTPLGRYEKAVGDAIGARWYFLVDERMSTLVRTSEVKVHFVVTRAGKIINTRVTGKDPNTALASVSLEAVANAEVPPIPPDVAALLPEGQLEGDFSFSFYN